MSDDLSPDTASSSDPELERELDRLQVEEDVRELYWALIGRCEETGIPLFQGLCSAHLQQWLCDGETSG